MRSSMSLRTRFFLLVTLGSIVTATAAYVLHFRFLDNLERQTIDLRFSLRGDRPPPKDIVIVKVDDVTFSEHKEWRWPFDRKLHAETLDQIRKGKPAAVAFDIQFSELGSAAGDNALGYALLRNRGKTVLATTEVTEKGEPNLIFDPSALKQLGARAGNANLPTDKDGIIRHFPFDVEGLKGFAVVAAEVARRSVITKSDMGAGMQWIDYAGSPGTVTSYSYSRVHDGKVPPSAFKGKVVVVGATAPSLQDIHATPTGAVMSGPEIQANAVETALRGFPLRSLPTLWNIVLIVALGLIVPLVSLRAGPLISVAVGILAFLLFSLGTQLAFEQGTVSSYVYPIAALAMATVGSIGVHYAIAAFERERVRDVFSRFVPEQIVDQVLEQADADLRLVGKEMVTTVLFSDLRGFTSSAETMPAENVIKVLNYYLHEMSEAILAHGGTLVCYMGDGIYAIFGAPLEYEDHADRALLAAREMLLERLPKFNNWMREQGYGEGYFMGVGLNSGPVMTGNVGHERRMDYTAVGDVTNTASRIEGMTKGTPFSVLIAESTIEMMHERPTDIVYYDELDVRGRVAKLKLWALDIRKPDDAPDLVAARKKEAEEHAEAAKEAVATGSVIAPAEAVAAEEEAGAQPAPVS
jgi:adenylate cyclase